MAGRIAYYGNIVTSGLVLNLDAAKRDSYPGSGTTWRDISGNDNNGTLTNGPTFNSDNYGSIVFDGVDDYAVVTGNYHLLSNFTISCWFKPKNTIAGGLNQVGRLWGKGANLECRFDGGAGATNGRLEVDISAAQSNLTSVQNIWLNTVWYNLVIVAKETTSEMYIQSLLNATGTRGSISDQTANLQIARSASGLGAVFPGNISSFLIYSFALSASEIQQNYNATKTRYGL